MVYDAQKDYLADHFLYMNKIRHAEGWALLLAVAYYALVFVCFTPSYETNDDVAMQVMASGNASGAPSAFLVYVGLFWGCLLKALYLASDGCNWYLAMLYSLNFLAVFSLVRIFLRSGEVRLGLVLLLFFLVLNIHLVVRLQFTSTALLLGAASFLQLLSAGHSKMPVWEFVYGCVLLVFGVCLRFDIAYVFVAICLPLLLLSLSSVRFRVSLVVLLGLLFLLKSAEMSLYERITGLHYREYLYAQDAIFDNPANITGGVLEIEHWSDNDLLVLSKWFFFDNEVFSPDKLIDFSKRIASNTDPYAFLQKATLLCRSKIAYYLIPLLLLVSLLGRDTRYRRMAVGFLFLVLGLLGLLLLVFRLPDRLSIPIFLTTYLFYAYLLLRQGPGGSRFEQVVIPLFAVCVSAFLVADYRQFSAENSGRISAFREFLAQAGSLQDKYLIFADPDFPAQGISERNNARAARNIRIIGGGWSILSPAYEERMRELKTTNVMRSIPNDERILVVTRDTVLLNSICDFYREHYAWQVRYDAWRPGIYRFTVDR